MPADRILNYWPDFYKEIADFIALADAQTPEVEGIEKAVQQLFDDQFVMTSSPQAIERREKMLGIQADPANESLDFRKKRILNRYQTKPPFTIRYLQRQLDRLIGTGAAIVSVDVQNFILYVTANIDNANIFKEVKHTVETIKPANLEYQQNTSIQDAIALEEHIKTSVVTWNYRLDGSWTLGAKPFASYGPEVIIK